jgi:hypothetical protein
LPLKCQHGKLSSTTSNPQRTLEEVPNIRVCGIIRREKLRNACKTEAKVVHNNFEAHWQSFNGNAKKCTVINLDQL